MTELLIVLIFLPHLAERLLRELADFPPLEVENLGGLLLDGQGDLGGQQSSSRRLKHCPEHRMSMSSKALCKVYPVLSLEMEVDCNVKSIWCRAAPEGELQPQKLFHIDINIGLELRYQYNNRIGTSILDCCLGINIELVSNMRLVLRHQYWTGT